VLFACAGSLSLSLVAYLWKHVWGARLCRSSSGFPYARLSFKLAKFFLWPFGRYVVIFKGHERLHFESDEEGWLVGCVPLRE
jgi:uncharacterized membrane protein YccF (DUF307 family)